MSETLSAHSLSIYLDLFLHSFIQVARSPEPGDKPSPRPTTRPVSTATGDEPSEAFSFFKNILFDIDPGTRKQKNMDLFYRTWKWVCKSLFSRSTLFFGTCKWIQKVFYRRKRNKKKKVLLQKWHGWGRHLTVQKDLHPQQLSLFVFFNHLL